jgi:hypothetical protein
MTRTWILAAFALTLAVPTANAAPVGFVFQSWNNTWMNGGRALDPAALRARFGDHFAAVQRGKRTWVVTDPAALERIRHLYQPVIRIAEQETEIGSKQAATGSKEAEIGSEQASIGSQQAALATAGSDTREAMANLSARLRTLGDRLRVLGARERVLEGQERQLERRAADAEREALPAIERLFEELIAAGSAVEVR